MNNEGKEKYLSTLNKCYVNGTTNHLEHNHNVDYHHILLYHLYKDTDKWTNKTALDFGCGKGRNVSTMLGLADWKKIVGVDISDVNINYCKRMMPNPRLDFFKNNGEDLEDIESNSIDYVISTIVFQHICVRDLRLKLKEEIFRCMKPSGIFSFQMGYGFTSKNCDCGKPWCGKTQYLENNYDAEGSNGSNDVCITNKDELLQDIKNIGFKNIGYTIQKSFLDDTHPQWIYVACEK